LIRIHDQFLLQLSSKVFRDRFFEVKDFEDPRNKNYLHIFKFIILEQFLTQKYFFHPNNSKQIDNHTSS